MAPSRAFKKPSLASPSQTAARHGHHPARQGIKAAQILYEHEDVSTSGTDGEGLEHEAASAPSSSAFQLEQLMVQMVGDVWIQLPTFQIAQFFGSY